ncbi:MAG: ATP-binding protein [Candidatus Xenobiia bacterium LiM19]
MYTIAGMFYRRRVFSDLTRQISTREIIVLTGMRRVGKTTLLRMLFENLPSENKVFLDLENPMIQKIFEETDYRNVPANLREFSIRDTEQIFIFIDEIQAMPSIVKVLKYLYDHFSIKFFVTGSCSYYLKNYFPESLAGRKLIFELFPLDFEEFLIFKQEKRQVEDTLAGKEKHKNKIRAEILKNRLDEYEEYGGFPQVVLEPDITQKKRFLDDIFTSYFEKEVTKLADFRKMSVFRDCMLLLMERTGSKLDITRLSSELGVSRDTVYSYIDFLAATYVIHLIPPFTKSRDREVSSKRKLYFCDTGMLNHFSRVSPGSLFENSVYLNLRKYGAVSYYQKRSGREIDFIIDGVRGIEVKRTPSEQDVRNLAALAAKLDLKEYYVAGRGYSSHAPTIAATDL